MNHPNYGKRTNSRVLRRSIKGFQSEGYTKWAFLPDWGKI